jgi:hypothetical protein
MDPVSYVEEATALYKAYDCSFELSRPQPFFAAVPFSRLFPWDDVPINSGSLNQSGTNEDKPFTPEDQTPIGILDDPSDLDSHYVPVDEKPQSPTVDERPNENPLPHNQGDNLQVYKRAGGFPLEAGLQQRKKCIN